MYGNHNFIKKERICDRILQFSVCLADREKYTTFGGKWFDNNALVRLSMNCKNKLASQFHENKSIFSWQTEYTVALHCHLAINSV